MASYKLTEAALEDLDGLYEFGILQFGLVQADNYYDGVVAQFQRIVDSPLSYPLVNAIRPGYRRATHLSHSVYYRIDEGEIVIARILGRQNPSGAV